MKQILLALFILILSKNIVIAQEITKLDDVSAIKFATKGNQNTFPIMDFYSPTPLELTFDILGQENKTIGYRIIYCDANWKPSQITISNYLDNMFNEFLAEDFDYSFNTKVNYTHYSIEIPNDDFRIKLSGNYLIEIYDEDNPENILFTRRFLVSENAISITGSVRKDNNSKYFESNQIVTFTVNDENSIIKYPRRNITAIVSQNFKWNNEDCRNVKPLFISKNTMQFKYMNRVLSFNGGYEFPYFNTTDILQPNNTIHSIETDEQGFTHCYINPDKDANKNYFLVKDINGNFQHRAYNTENPNIEGEYAFVHFSFVSKELPFDVYVCGFFNNWETNANNLMAYDSRYGFYHTNLFLKQGVYNYTYIGKTAENKQINLLGNFAETENDYYIFIYNKDESLRADKLIGWKRLNSITDKK